LEMIHTRKIIFVTSNQGKVESANKYFDGKVVFDTYDYEIPEIRGSLNEIAVAKVKAAYEKTSAPTIAMDAGFVINELNGFPGNYVNFALGTIGIKGILKLMEDKEKRECSFVQCLAYYDGEDEPRIFYGKHQGHITYEERGVISKDDWSELSLIFIPEGEWNTTGRTLAELTHEERVRITRDNDNSAFAKFRDWYLNTMKK
jgi:XTP/dITP diphosphohydrolase